MNVITSRTERATSLVSSPGPTASTASATASSLVPEPATPGLDGAQDAMSMMYDLVAQQGQLSMSSAEAGVSAQTRQQAAQQNREEAALKQQEADLAKMNTGGGLFGSICHIFNNIGRDLEHGQLWDLPTDAASDTVNFVDDPQLLPQLEALAPQVAEYVGVAAAVVGATALTAASCGTAGVAVAAVVIALSASGMLVAKTGCLGKDSAYVGLGLEAAGAALSLGASSTMLASDAAQTATAVANCASGAADVGAGAASIAVGREQADVLDDSANVQQAVQAMNRNARIVADLVTGLKEAQSSNSKALQILTGAVQTYNQSLTLASAAKA
jgi:hypothetical protein